MRESSFLPTIILHCFRIYPPAPPRRDQSDSDGSFALRDVAPGRYTVVAIEDGWDLDWARPEVIGRYLSGGIPVTVTESSGKLLRLSQAVPVQGR
jgi:hypothetical protein